MKKEHTNFFRLSRGSLLPSEGALAHAFSPETVCGGGAKKIHSRVSRQQRGLRTC